MPVEDIFSITGRGTVEKPVSWKRGILKVSDEVELVGLFKSQERLL